MHRLRAYAAVLLSILFCLLPPVTPNTLLSERLTVDPLCPASKVDTYFADTTALLASTHRSYANLLKFITSSKLAPSMKSAHYAGGFHHQAYYKHKIRSVGRRKVG